MHFRVHWWWEKNIPVSQYCEDSWIEMNVKQLQYYGSNKRLLCTVGLWPYQSKISSYFAFIIFLIVTSTSVVSKVTKRFFLRRWKKIKIHFFTAWTTGWLQKSHKLEVLYYEYKIWFFLVLIFFFANCVIFQWRNKNLFRFNNDAL